MPRYGLKKKGKKPKNLVDESVLIAFPRVPELPNTLLPSLKKSSIPSAVCDALAHPEFFNLQPYFPTQESLRHHEGGVEPFTGTSKCWLGATNIEKIEFDISSNIFANLKLIDSEDSVKLFVKRAHLINPLDAIRGDLVWPLDGALSAPINQWKPTLERICNPLNEAYIDGVFALLANRMVSNNISPHWCKCFGTLSARVNKYLYNMTDEVDSLRENNWFKQNQKKNLFKVIVEKQNEHLQTGSSMSESGTVNNVFGNDQDLELDDFEELSQIETFKPNVQSDKDNESTSEKLEDESEDEESEDESEETESEETEDEETEDESSEEFEDEIELSVSDKTSDVSEGNKIELCKPLIKINKLKDSKSSHSKSDSSKKSDDSDNSEEIDSSESSNNSDDNMTYDETKTFAEFTNYPVQISLLERADGTMEDLIEEQDEEDHLKDLKWAAWIFQVVAALCEAQYYYGFVHNDLHTHNVMFVNTDIEILHYKIVKEGVADQFISVPTFGKLMKIIDFGRASFTLPESHGGFYISDAFFDGNDAAEQYNCEPFYDPSNGPKLEPNPSFDLCRFSVSLIESLYPTKPEALSPTKIMNKEGSKIYTETISPVYNLLWSWLLDDKQHNIMRLPNGKERYPSFELYQKIASEVHGAIPSKQIFKEAFLCFKQESESSLSNDTKEVIYTIHI
jgi:hypothetical protein